MSFNSFDLCISAPQKGKLRYVPATLRTRLKALHGYKALIATRSEELNALLHDVLNDVGACCTHTTDPYDLNNYIAWGGFDLLFVQQSAEDLEQLLQFVRRVRPAMLERIVVFTGAGDAEAEAKLQRRFLSCVFRPLVLTEVVEYGLQTIADSERRFAA